MQKRIIRKGLVIGIIVLFIGASVVSGIEKRVQDVSKDTDKNQDYVEDKIDGVENYMKEHLGSDWLQIKNNWTQFKDGEISRGEFAKLALKKLGKIFLGIFVSTSS